VNLVERPASKGSLVRRVLHHVRSIALFRDVNVSKMLRERGVCGPRVVGAGFLLLQLASGASGIRSVTAIPVVNK
jgi:hypothetical protein